MTKNEALIEDLARYAHDEAWAGWLKYMFSKCEVGCERDDAGDFLEDGTLIIPKESVERWTRQMNMHYDELPEEEKESDRAEARKMIAVLEASKS